MNSNNLTSKSNLLPNDRQRSVSAMANFTRSASSSNANPYFHQYRNITTDSQDELEQNNASDLSYDDEFPPIARSDSRQDQDQALSRFARLSLRDDEGQNDLDQRFSRSGWTPLTIPSGAGIENHQDQNSFTHRVQVHQGSHSRLNSTANHLPDPERVYHGQHRQTMTRPVMQQRPSTADFNPAANQHVQGPYINLHHNKSLPGTSISNEFLLNLKASVPIQRLQTLDDHIKDLNNKSSAFASLQANIVILKNMAKTIENQEAYENSRASLQMIKQEIEVIEDKIRKLDTTGINHEQIQFPKYGHNSALNEAFSKADHVPVFDSEDDKTSFKSTYTMATIFATSMQLSQESFKLFLTSKMKGLAYEACQHYMHLPTREFILKLHKMFPSEKSADSYLTKIKNFTRKPSQSLESAISQLRFLAEATAKYMPDQNPKHVTEVLVKDGIQRLMSTNAWEELRKKKENAKQAMQPFDFIAQAIALDNAERSMTLDPILDNLQTFHLHAMGHKRQAIDQPENTPEPKRPNSPITNPDYQRSNFTSQRDLQTRQDQRRQEQKARFRSQSRPRMDQMDHRHRNPDSRDLSPEQRQRRPPLIARRSSNQSNWQDSQTNIRSDQHQQRSQQFQREHEHRRMDPRSRDQDQQYRNQRQREQPKNWNDRGQQMDPRQGNQRDQANRILRESRLDQNRESRSSQQQRNFSSKFQGYRSPSPNFRRERQQHPRARSPSPGYGSYRREPNNYREHFDYPRGDQNSGRGNHYQNDYGSNQHQNDNGSSQQRQAYSSGRYPGRRPSFHHRKKGGFSQKLSVSQNTPSLSQEISFDDSDFYNRRSHF